MKAHAALRKRLETSRSELRQRLGLEPVPDLGSRGDEADEVASRELRLVAFATVDQMRRSLHAIDQALDRIHAGTYGACLGCAEPIPPRRLEALPWADRCVPCTVADEQRRSSLDHPTLRPRPIADEPGDGDALLRRDIIPPDPDISDLQVC